MQFRVIFVITLFFFSAIPYSNAQLGVRGGVNLAAQSTDQEGGGSERKLGLALGFNYRIKVTDNFFIQPELNFIQHGTQETVDFLGAELKLSQTLGYVQIPVLAKYSFGNLEGLSYYVQAGPYLGLGIGIVKAKICSDGECNTVDAEYGEDSGLEKIDFGAHMGAGVHITKNVSVDARYILGLRDIDIDEEVSLKNNGIFVSIGYTF